MVKKCDLLHFFGSYYVNLCQKVEDSKDILLTPRNPSQFRRSGEPNQLDAAGLTPYIFFVARFPIYGFFGFCWG